MYRIAVITSLSLFYGCSGPATPPAAGPAATAGGQASPPADAPDKAAAAAPAVPEPGWQSTLSREHALVGAIWNVRENRLASREELAKRAAAAKFVLLGESHDNADHHQLQAEVIAMMTAAGRTPAVVFEMIDRASQETVDAQRKSAPDDVDGMGKALLWEKSGWPAWTLYRPIFAATMAARLAIVGAALPRAEAMELARGTRSLPPALVAKFKLDQQLPGPLHKSLLQQLQDSHCGHMPASMTEPMVGIQRARDALMAEGLAGRVESGAVLIAGGGHVRADRGVPWYLKHIGHSDEDMVAIGFMEVADDAQQAGEYGARYDGGLPFDYVWFTPRDNDIDRCKELMERMQRMKAKGAGKHGQ